MRTLRYSILSFILVFGCLGSGAGQTKDAGESTALPSRSGTAQTGTQENPDIPELLRVLEGKGILSPVESAAIRAADRDSQVRSLVEMLTRKGVLTAGGPAEPSVSGAAKYTAAARDPVKAEAHVAELKPAVAVVVAAVAPLRVLPIDPPAKDGLIPGFKLGGVKITPYGFIKATAVYDSSSPNGDDFPFPGIFLNSSSVFSTGPTRDPSFHLKARSSRFGANFEWPDASPKLTLTGRVEGDLEGNFSEVDNADVTSIRNPSPRLRVAFVRLDYAATAKESLFLEAGQNWTLFGSSALPNLLETTFLGAYSGDVWERAPQMRFGLVRKLGGARKFEFSPEFAVMMPGTGQIYKLNNALCGLEAQLGEAERQGADSGRPELEARTVLQFQLDRAPGVAPAQLVWSGFDARRTAITTNANLSGAPPDLLKQYPGGFTNSSSLYGNQFAAQLPTRWVTLVASGYRGADMRFMLGGQLNTFYTDTTGLHGVRTVETVDNVGVAGAQQIGCTVAMTALLCTDSGGSWRIAPQRPVGAFGGFVNIGLPLSRWFNADPKGRNAGWQVYLHAGKDQVVHADIRRALGIGCASADAVTACNGGIPLSQSRVLAATIYYKINPWATFGFEQSQYQTTLTPEAGPLYSIAGQASAKWKDQRREFGPIFTF
jgi:hypothetical protein